MEKWEHCVIASEQTGRGLTRGLCRVIYYMTVNGFRRHVIADKHGAEDWGEVMRNIDGPAIAQLGNEGWQLVHIADESGWTYFKRKVS